MQCRRFWPRRQTLLQIALLLTAVVPICVYVAFTRVEPDSPSYYIILAVAAVVAVYAAVNWAQWVMSKHPLIEVGADSLKVRKTLSAKYEEISYDSIVEIKSEDQVKSNVLRHRFVAYIRTAGSPTARDLPTPALDDPEAAERAITEAYQAYKKNKENG